MVDYDLVLETLRRIDAVEAELARARLGVEALQISKRRAESRVDEERAQVRVLRKLQQDTSRTATDQLRIARAEHDKVIKLEGALRKLILLVDHETDLPDSSANGVTDSTGMMDEGVVRASAILSDARALVPVYHPINHEPNAQREDPYYQ